MHVLVVKLARSNRVEREQERAIATEADDMARISHAAETGMPTIRLPRRELVKAMRKPMDVLLADEAGENVDCARVAKAKQELDELFATSTRDRLLAPGMARELGPTKAELLGRLVAQRP